MLIIVIRYVSGNVKDKWIVFLDPTPEYFNENTVQSTSILGNPV